jgi:hypothetical protein
MLQLRKLHGLLIKKRLFVIGNWLFGGISLALIAGGTIEAKRIFVLGAGFSKQTGMPLATELTEPLLHRFKECNFEEIGKKISNYYRAVGEWYGKQDYPKMHPSTVLRAGYSTFL